MFRALLTSILLTILFSSVAYANTYAVVTGSLVNVRSTAEISPTNRLFQVERGTEIQVHGIYGDFFSATINDTSDVFIAHEFVQITQTTATVTAEPFATVSAAPDSFGFSFIPHGETVIVKYVYEDFFGIEFNDEIAFVAASAIDIADYVTLPKASGFRNGVADDIIETAKKYLGTRYLAGGATPNGFDCSGFVTYVFRQHGYTFERSSRGMAAHNGVTVARDELLPGDLIFFGYGSSTINHVGIYIGEGKFIHSSTNTSGGVIICNLSDAHNCRAYITAKRVIE